MKSDQVDVTPFSVFCDFQQIKYAEEARDGPIRPIGPYESSSHFQMPQNFAPFFNLRCTGSAGAKLCATNSKANSRFLVVPIKTIGTRSE